MTSCIAPLAAAAPAAAVAAAAVDPTGADGEAVELTKRALGTILKPIFRR